MLQGSLCPQNTPDPDAAEPDKSALAHLAVALPRKLPDDALLGWAQSGRQVEQLEIALFDRGSERPILSYQLRGALVASYAYSVSSVGGDLSGAELVDLWFDSATVTRGDTVLEIQGGLRKGVPPIQTVATCAATTGSAAKISAPRLSVENAVIGSLCIQVGRRTSDQPLVTLGATTVDDTSTAFALAQAELGADRFDATVELLESDKPMPLQCDGARVRQAELLVTPSARFQLECSELRPR